ncbi:ABC-2 type transport system ATP-binding protein [Chitinophaga ginsengisegetis]|uniref:ABC-2 type transport system ATP-binding protein n=1 Tax=Chitinophaga ginsengisegetis TaxID=393003 RepID=A0A1T5ND83_9BACT|nr:ABC transporter ATP-binding protein [Chitinophaga ginsengisegetis]MDR6570614.1 ABC-2 type transport system ATP-binding protein [Chitinophaga ginsengisegetis]MDR6650348.1 ABC-2 type transport system ATP-binding protein [Chitinophaga ginsengisegetis]MDR6656533.1 ABC-2 type transport system ATP-binding protein [Chitinophaga ginsengisegetis]SKC98233.1 ABC-2 type transport system ATP-binding protein [Chitinophaga ginsengisegetis]
MTSIVKLERLSHKYSSSWAIRDINIEISKTGIVGLLGSNGAGKSTTMNILCGALNQTEGNVYINGINMREDPQLAKREIGFLPQNPPLYMDLTVDEYLGYCAGLRQLPKDRMKPAIKEAKERCGIDHFSSRLIRNLSGGYRQRVGIAQAIVHRPRLVVLDEPTNGLDPNQITEVRSLIKEIAQDRAVIFSSHILSEIQLLCKEIKMIENGRIVFSDSMDAFNNYVEPHSVMMHLENPPAAAELLKIDGVTKADFLTERQVRLYFNGNQDITEKLIIASVQNGWRLREINLDKTALDEIFKQLSSQSSQ